MLGQLNLVIVIYSLFLCPIYSYILPITSLKLLNHNKLYTIKNNIENDHEIKLSNLVNGISVSKTIEIHTLTKEMEAQGETVYSLCVGEPDYQPPTEVIDATINALKQGRTKYTAVNGELKLRSGIINDLKLRKNLDYDPNEIVVSNGAKQSVMQALMAIVNTNDDVLIIAPYWPSYPDMIKICGGNPVVLQTAADNNYWPTPVELRTKLLKHPKTSTIILCNPSNPTGCVSKEDVIKKTAEVLKEFPHITTINDEIYEQLCYDNTKHVSLASIEGMKDKCIVINGFSKSHSMTGYRIGYAAAPIHVAKAMSKLQSQFTSCASSVSQAASIAALTVPDTWIEERVEELQNKRDLAFNLLQEIDDITCVKPLGAFYLLPDVSAYFNKMLYTDSSDGGTGVVIDSSLTMCLELLRVYNVALVPGEAFGAPNTLRISYAASTGLIRTALGKFKQFLERLE